MTYDETLEAFEAFDTEILPALDDATDTQIDLRAVPPDVAVELQPIEIERLEDVAGGRGWRHEVGAVPAVDQRRGPPRTPRDRSRRCLVEAEPRTAAAAAAPPERALGACRA